MLRVFICRTIESKMTTLDGKAIDQGAPFIISNQACHETVLKILNANGGYQKYR